MTSGLGKILIADDDAVVHELVAAALHARGLAVASVINGEEATTCSTDEQTSKQRHIRRCDRTYAHL
jgi:CheY-like chemotaxis protein